MLGLLATAGERSGYELAKLAENGIAYLWTPSRSQIYKVLPRLVAAGFARMREVEQRGRPDKALYQLTSVGLEALRRWLEEVEEEAAYRRFLERRLESYERLEARAASPRRYPEHVLQHGLARVRATLAWIDDTTAAIESDLDSATQRRSSLGKSGTH